MTSSRQDTLLIESAPVDTEDKYQERRDAILQRASAGQFELDAGVAEHISVFKALLGAAKRVKTEQLLKCWSITANSPVRAFQSGVVAQLRANARAFDEYVDIIAGVCISEYSGGDEAARRLFSATNYRMIAKCQQYSLEEEDWATAHTALCTFYYISQPYTPHATP